MITSKPKIKTSVIVGATGSTAHEIGEYARRGAIEPIEGGGGRGVGRQFSFRGAAGALFVDQLSGYGVKPSAMRPCVSAFEQVIDDHTRDSPDGPRVDIDKIPAAAIYTKSGGLVTHGYRLAVDRHAADVGVYIPLKALVAEAFVLIHVFSAQPSARPYALAQLAKIDRSIVAETAEALLDQWLVAIDDTDELAALAERLGMSPDETKFQVRAARWRSE